MFNIYYIYKLHFQFTFHNYLNSFVFTLSIPCFTYSNEFAT
nr:MAG TPA: hypothetical protein [Caudoviricetes sp.]